MSDVFISYSRKDSDFVHKLDEALRREKRDVWVDWQDIARGEDWWRSIQTGVDSADTTLIVITEHWLVSEVCQRELEYVRQQNKRVFPIIRQKIEDEVAIRVKGTWVDQEWETRARDNWKYLRSVNWLYFDDDTAFDTVFKDLLTALDTDQLYVKSHTRYLVRALEWQQFNRNPSFLLEGDQLTSAKTWLDSSANKHPEPHPAHHEYVGASRIAETARIARDKAREGLIRRFRQTATILGLAVVVAIIAAVVIGQQFIVARAEVTRAGATLQQVNIQVTAAINQQSTAVAQVQAAEALVGTATIEQGNAVIAQSTSAAREQLASTQVAIAGATLSPVPPTLTSVALAISDANIQQEIALQISDASLKLIDGDSQAALQAMDDIVEAYPDETAAYLGRGLILDSLGRTDEAMANYTKAIEVDPENSIAYYDRALVYSRLDDLDKAKADYTSVIQYDPESADAYVNRADIYAIQGENDNALADYTQAIELDPSAENYIFRGLFYKSIDQFDEAFQDYQSALEIDSENADAHAGVASIYLNKEQFDDALTEYNRAIELNPDNAVFYSSRGLIYEIQKEFDKAITDYQTAIQLDPEYADAYYNVGYVLQLQGKFDLALEAFDEALGIDPNQKDAHLARAAVYAHRGQMEEASADYLKWIELNQSSIDQSDIVAQSQIPFKKTVTMTEGVVYKIPFEGRAGQLLQASAVAQTGDSVDVDALLVVLDPYGHPVMFANDTEANKDAMFTDYALPTDGLYTLVVSYGVDGSEGNLDVTLKLTSAAAATPEATP